MKKVLLIASCVAATGLSAQSWQKASTTGKSFQEIRKEAQKNFFPTKSTKPKKGYKQFKRWEAFWESRLDANGNIPSPAILYNTWNSQKGNFGFYKSSAQWTYVGPDKIPSPGTGAYAGKGRVNRIVFEPGNNNTIWAATPSGGLWKSTDAGVNWTAMAQDLPTLGISDIAIDPNNKNTMYLATGDVDGPDTYGVGVMKSTDGGSTWNTTGLSTSITDFKYVSRLLLEPTSGQIIIAAASDGMQRSTDGGTNWTNTQAGEFVDVQVKPGGFTDFVAGTKDGKVYKSTDGGVSWTQVSTGLPSGKGRVKLAYAPSDGNYVYALIDNGSGNMEGLYQSTDGGSNWTAKNTQDNILGGQGFYDISIVVKPDNKNTLYAGGVDLYKSTDGGTTLEWMTDGNEADPQIPYVHSDHHNLVFQPGSNTTMFSCHDGGIHKVETTDLTKWTDLSENLNNTQFYRLGITQNAEDRVIAGAQDNDVALLKGTTWHNVNNLSDGMECAIDHENTNYMYSCSQSGALYGSSNQFATAGNYIKPSNASNGVWTIPYLLDPKNANTMIAGFGNLLKNTNIRSVTSQTNWTDITPGSHDAQNYDFVNIAIAPSNSSYIYASTKKYQGNDGKIWSSKDGGSNWTDVSSGLPISSNQYVLYIAVNSTDANELWVVTTGYVNGKKVYHSTDAGQNWSNISGDLPNISVRCITHETGSNKGLYIGTDIGVYHKEGASTNWKKYGNGLPNTIVNEIEIYYPSKKLKIATYGRGIWEAPSALSPTSAEQTKASDVFSVFPSPASSTVTVRLGDLEGQSQIIVYNVVGGVFKQQQLSKNNQFVFDVSKFASGTYFVTVINDSKSYTQSIIVK